LNSGRRNRGGKAVEREKKKVEPKNAESRKMPAGMEKERIGKWGIERNSKEP